MNIRQPDFDSKIQTFNMAYKKSGSDYFQVEIFKFKLDDTRDSECNCSQILKLMYLWQIANVMLYHYGLAQWGSKRRFAYMDEKHPTRTK